MRDSFVEQFHFAGRAWRIILTSGVIVLLVSMPIIAYHTNPEMMPSGIVLVGIVGISLIGPLAFLWHLTQFCWQVSPTSIRKKTALRHRVIRWTDVRDLRFEDEFQAMLTTTDNVKLDVPIHIFDNRQRFLELLITFIPHSRIHMASPLSPDALKKHKTFIFWLSLICGMIGTAGSVWFVFAEYRIALLIGMAIGAPIFVQNPVLSGNRPILSILLPLSGIHVAEIFLEHTFETVPSMHLFLASFSGFMLAYGSVLFFLRRTWHASLIEQNQWPERLETLLRDVAKKEGFSSKPERRFSSGIRETPL